MHPHTESLQHILLANARIRRERSLRQPAPNRHTSCPRHAAKIPPLLDFPKA